MVNVEYIQNALSGIVGNVNIQDITITELKGDASDRRYRRVVCRYSEKPNSFILMTLSKPHCEEFELPFFNIQRYLKTIGIPVPVIYWYDQKNGHLLLEDLGDTTLEERVREKSTTVQQEYYQEAIDILIRMQFPEETTENKNCTAFTYGFTLEKFMEELEVFQERAVKDLFKKKIHNEGELRRSFHRICDVLTEAEYCFTHRDYHSKNIMATDGSLVVIDFQDARMGPYQYDVASLLHDSYRVLSEDLFEELLVYYIRKNEKAQQRRIDYVHFRKVFDYMCIQRNLKAIGTFAYQEVVKNNNRYVEYIPATIQYVKKNIEKYPELSVLKEYVEGHKKGA